MPGSLFRDLNSAQFVRFDDWFFLPVGEKFIRSFTEIQRSEGEPLKHRFQVEPGNELKSRNAIGDRCVVYFVIKEFFL